MYRELVFNVPRQEPTLVALVSDDVCHSAISRVKAHSGQIDETLAEAKRLFAQTIAVGRLDAAIEAAQDFINMDPIVQQARALRILAVPSEYVDSGVLIPKGMYTQPMYGHSHNSASPSGNICWFPNFPDLPTSPPFGLSAREFDLKPFKTNDLNAGRTVTHIRAHLSRETIFSGEHPNTTMSEFFGVNPAYITARKPSVEYGGVFRRGTIFWDGQYNILGIA